MPREAKVRKGDIISPEKQMSIEAQWEIATDKISEKYEYVDNDEDGENF